MKKAKSVNVKNIAKDVLVSAGISPSVQRLEIMTYLLAHKNHPSVDAIYAHLKDDLPTLSKTTVYNTLKLFLKEGLIITLNIDSKEERFDITIDKHAHFLCTTCGKIEDVENEDIVKVLSSQDVSGNEIDFSIINFLGICKECKDKADL